MLALCENIRRLRRARGLSQEELAGRLGVILVTALLLKKALISKGFSRFLLWINLWTMWITTMKKLHSFTVVHNIMFTRAPKSRRTNVRLLWLFHTLFQCGCTQ